MIAYLIQVTICMAVFYSFYHIALRRETLFQSNRFYLLGTLMLSLVLPLIRIYVNQLHTNSIVMQAPVYVGSYFQNLEDGITVTPEEHSFPWKQALMIIYGVGVGLMTIRLFLSLRAITLMREKASSLFIENRVCIMSPKVKSPFSFFNTIYLPADHSYSEEELKEVICHERAHVVGRHSWDVMIMEVAGILLWSNPFIYLYRKALREIHEYVADAAVINNDPWEQYAQFLISQKYPGLHNQLSNQLIYSQLKNRLVMMTQKPSSVLAKWKYSGVIPILLMAMLIFSFREKENGVVSTLNSGAENIAINSIADNTEPPLFPGCEKVNEMEKADCSHKLMYEYVAQHLQYPEEMKKNKLEGKVYVKFVITNNGFVADVRIQKSLSPAADKAALDVVNGMNDNVGKWTPGTKEGIPVTMDMMLPISFVLSTSPEQNAKTNTISNADSTSKSSAAVYTYVEEMPRFPGCNSDFTSGDCSEIMYKYITENIHYPAEDLKNGKQGAVMAQFTVQADGLISDAKILRGITPSMNEEVLRMINSMNSMPQRWIPGKKDGKPVAVLFTLPVKFVLPAENKEAAQPAEPMKGASSQVDENKPANLHNATNEQDKSAAPGLHLLPNPTRDHVIVELFEGAKTIFLYDAGGIQLADIDVSKINDPHYRLDVSRYPAGQYSVQLISSTKSLSGSFTVIK